MNKLVLHKCNYNFCSTARAQKSHFYLVHDLPHHQIISVIARRVSSPISINCALESGLAEACDRGPTATSSPRPNSILPPQTATLISEPKRLDYRGSSASEKSARLEGQQTTRRATTMENNAGFILLILKSPLASLFSSPSIKKSGM